MGCLLVIMNPLFRFRRSSGNRFDIAAVGF